MRYHQSRYVHVYDTTPIHNQPKEFKPNKIQLLYRTPTNFADGTNDSIDESSLVVRTIEGQVASLPIVLAAPRTIPPYTSYSISWFVALYIYRYILFSRKQVTIINYRLPLHCTQPTKCLLSLFLTWYQPYYVSTRRSLLCLHVDVCCRGTITRAVWAISIGTVLYILLYLYYEVDAVIAISCF